MRPLTDFVLRHKRLVALAWVVLTLVGMAAAGPASEALDQKFSVPGREGWDTSQEILKVYGTGGETLPLVPVVKLPEGKTVDSPGVRAQLLKIEATAKKTDARARGWRASAPPATGRSSRRTGAPRSCTPSPRSATTRSAPTPR